MKLLTVVTFLIMVHVCECVVFSWILELQLLQGSGDNSTDSDTQSVKQKLCKKDRHCDTGYCHRHFHTCHECKTVGQKCRRDHVCCKGHECVFGSCRKIVKRGLYMARCKKDKDCKKGLCCAKSHGEFVCKPMLRENQLCSVLEGGVEYTINHGCPCDDGLTCKKVQQKKWLKGGASSKRKTTIRRCQKSDF